MSKQREKLGWNDVAVFGPGSLYSPKLLELGGSSVEGLHTSTIFMETDPRPEVQEFVKTFKARNNNVAPNMFAAIAYDAITILANTIEKAGTDRKAIRDELAKMKDFVGMTGKFSFTERRDVKRDYHYLVVKTARGPCSTIGGSRPSGRTRREGTPPAVIRSSPHGISMLLQQIVNGLTQGSLYALVAIGFVIIFGTMNLVTFAHGEVYMIGAFVGYFVMSVWGLPWPVPWSWRWRRAGFWAFSPKSWRSARCGRSGTCRRCSSPSACPSSSRRP